VAKKALGRGLSSLMPESVAQAEAQGDRVLSVPLSGLTPNPDQPRKDFHQEQLEELAASIREKGVIQPLVAEPLSDGRYMIIAGERRYRASRLAGLESVPVVVRSFSEEDKLEIGLIENIQREDLNAIEEAQGYRNLMNRFGLTQEDVSRKLGKSRSAVANSLRLLKLPEHIQSAISDDRISAGHARALLSVNEEQTGQLEVLFELICSEGLSVRLAEKAARMINDGSRLDGLHAELIGAEVPPEDKAENDRLRRELIDLASGATKRESTDRPHAQDNRRDPALWDMEEKLIQKTGTKVEIRGNVEKGRIEIHYFNKDDLQRLYDLLLDE
jgi:ParB family chromosome partitioning protein